MSKEAEAAACEWFMFTLLPTYKDALESVAAGCLPGVNSGMNAKVNAIKHSVHCIPALMHLFRLRDLAAAGKVGTSSRTHLCCRPSAA